VGEWRWGRRGNAGLHEVISMGWVLLCELGGPKKEWDRKRPRRRTHFFLLHLCL